MFLSLHPYTAVEAAAADQDAAVEHMGAGGRLLRGSVTDRVNAGMKFWGKVSGVRRCRLTSG